MWKIKSRHQSPFTPGHNKYLEHVFRGKTEGGKCFESTQLDSRIHTIIRWKWNHAWLRCFSNSRITEERKKFLRLWAPFAPPLVAQCRVLRPSKYTENFSWYFFLTGDFHRFSQSLCHVHEVEIRILDAECFLLSFFLLAYFRHAEKFFAGIHRNLRAGDVFLRWSIHKIQRCHFFLLTPAPLRDTKMNTMKVQVFWTNVCFLIK